MGELEGLGVAHGLLLIINQKGAGDHDENAAAETRLDIGGCYLVLNLLEWQSLLEDQQRSLTYAPEVLTTSFSAI